MAETQSEAELTAPIPMKWIGPIRIGGNVLSGEQEVPLATYETTLWPSVRRGAHVSQLVDDGIICTLVDERMTRSVLFEADSAASAYAAAREIERDTERLQEVVAGTSRFAKLIQVR